MKRFEDPIAIEGGKPLLTLKDAAGYVQKLSKAEQQSHTWQLAVEILISAAEHRDLTMHARIAVMRALNAGRPAPAPTPKAKARKPVTIIR